MHYDFNGTIQIIGSADNQNEDIEKARFELMEKFDMHLIMFIAKATKDPEKTTMDMDINFDIDDLDLTLEALPEE